MRDGTITSRRLVATGGAAITGGAATTPGGAATTPGGAVTTGGGACRADSNACSMFMGIGKRIVDCFSAQIVFRV